YTDLGMHGGGGQQQQQQQFLEKDPSNAFESMFPALGSSVGDMYGQQQQHPQRGHSMHMVSQRSSLSVLGGDGELGDRRGLFGSSSGGGGGRGGGGPLGKMSMPPGFGGLNGGGSQSSFYSGQQQQQQQQASSSSGGGVHHLHQSSSAANILQPRATSFPSLSSFNNSGAANSSNTNNNNSGASNNSNGAFGNLYSQHDSLQQQHQQQQLQHQHQQQQQQQGPQSAPLRHLSSSQGLYTSYNHHSSDFMSSSADPADEYQQMFGGPSSAGILNSNNAAPPQPASSSSSSGGGGMGGHSFQKPILAVKRHSLKPSPMVGMAAANVLGGVGNGLSTPPPTPFSRTNSPLYPMNGGGVGSAVVGGGSNVDVLASRLVQLEAENAALRRSRLTSSTSSLSISSGSGLGVVVPSLTSSAIPIVAPPSASTPVVATAVSLTGSTVSSVVTSPAVADSPGVTGSGVVATAGVGESGTVPSVTAPVAAAVSVSTASSPVSSAVSSPTSPRVNDEARRDVLVKSLLVMVAKGASSSSDGVSHHNDSETEQVVESGEIETEMTAVDWKASFEAAVEELVKLQETNAHQRGEFEKFQAVHKNCGFLQGLLNICD
ncbi:hypothetical protein HDU98_003861, partial [Podochytrium sp. JEL0797]